MIATFAPCKLAGVIDAPPSKSMAHRYLIGAALSGKVCTLSGVDYSEDILASMDCLKALGAKISVQGDRVTVDPSGFMQVDAPVLECRESGSTLRFFIPLALCLGKTVTLRGSQRLMERPLKVYEDLCADNGFFFHKTAETVTLCGRLESGDYAIRGDVSSQFITGMIFALVYLGQVATIRILPPFESRSYVRFTDDYTVSVASSTMHSYTGRIEGDHSNAAFLDAFNLIGSQVHVENLNVDSLQGDRVYRDYFRQLSQGTPTLDISDCPDLGPVLFALAALNHGAVFTGTDRLKVKESDRGQAMYE